MKIETRLGKVTKVGYTSEADKGTATTSASSRLPYFEIDPNKGRTPLDDFMTSQNPVTSFVRGFLRGLGKVFMFAFYSLGFIIPFWIVINLF